VKLKLLADAIAATDQEQTHMIIATKVIKKITELSQAM